VEIHAVQDAPGPQSYNVRTRLCRLDGTVLETHEVPVTLNPQRGKLLAELDFTAHAEGEGRGNVFLHVEMMDETGALAAVNHAFFTAPRYLALRHGDLSTRLRGLGGGEWELTLSSDVFMYSVCLELDGASGKWSDNFFHLLPHEEKRVVVHVASPAGSDAEPNVLTEPKVIIKSLLDTY
jgi:hypothetical protein